MKIILFFVLLGLNSRAQPCWECNISTHTNYKIIKKWGVQIDTTKVQINGVYLFEIENKAINGENKIYTFLRFFDDGRVYSSCVYCSFPTKEQINSLNHGEFSYYRIKDNIVTIEYYNSYRRYYFSHYTIIDSAELISLGPTQRKWRGKFHFTPYPKIKCHFLSFLG